MGFAEKEQKRKKGVVSAIVGVGSEELIPGQQDKDISTKGKGRPKADRETKVRKTLALYPSIYEDVTKIAYVDRTSVSEIVCDFLEEYVKSNSDKLKEYERLKK